MKAAIVLTLLLSVPAAARAQSSPPRYDAAWHGGIAAATFLGAGLFKWVERHTDAVCTWCGVDAAGQPDPPGLDAWARSHWRWASEDRADTLSHVGAGVAYAWPVIGLAAVHGGVDQEWGRDFTAAMSSLGVAQLAADWSKRAFRRARPEVVFREHPVDTLDDVHSFMSGHTATTFAAVVSAGTIASRRNSRQAAWIWIGGLSVAGGTGYLRIAADRHFLTDVLVGAAAGTAAGLMMPRVFDEDYSSSAAPAVVGLPIVAMGPVVRVAADGPAPVTVQFGAGARSIGLMGTVGLR